MKMEDPSNNRTIDKIFHSVFSGGVDWDSPQVKSSCPPREKWSWKKIWNWLDKFDKKQDNSSNQAEKKETFQRLTQSREQKMVDKFIDPNDLSRCGPPYCDIKMQDPCALCCCEIECIEPPSCTDIPPIERSPTCDCAKRKQIKIGEKCCDACGAGLEVI